VSVTKRQREILSHSLGLTTGTSPFRNHFAAGLGSPDHRAILTLVRAGLMTPGDAIPGGLQYFHVTEAGRGAIGAPAALYPEDVYAS
jgi:hypothetical protein